MKLTFTPQRADTRLCLERLGDVLIVNGAPFDFSSVPEGAVLPRSAVSGVWLASDVERRGGVLEMTVIVPHGIHAPEAAGPPATTQLVEGGPVCLPDFGDAP